MSRPIWARGALVRVSAARVVLTGAVERVSRRPGEHRAPRRRQRREIGDELVTIAAVDRVNELDDLVALRVRHAVEEKRRRVEWDAKGRRLLLVGDRRLDRLHAAGDHDPEAVAQKLVERPLFEIALSQPGHERLADVERLDRHGLVVGEPEALRDDDRLRRRDVEEPPQARARRDDLQRKRPTARLHSSPAHVLGEGRHRQLLGDLRLADEGARPTTADHVALARQLVERRAKREPRHAEIRAELALGRDRLTHAEAFDQVEHAVPGLALLGHGAAASSSAGSASRSSAANGRRAPLRESKKCRRAGSAASLIGAPTRACVVGPTRAANSAFDSGSSVASSSAERSRISAVTGGASTGKNTSASEPSSSTTAGVTSSVEPAAPVSSKASGRMPRITFPGESCGRRRSSSRSRKPPNTISSPSIVASTRFMAGVPMNAATKTLSGRS